MQREAGKGSGNNIPRLGVWGMKSPNVPQSRSEKGRQGARRSLTDFYRMSGSVWEQHDSPSMNQYGSS